MIAAAAGLRIGEILLLTTDDVTIIKDENNNVDAVVIAVTKGVVTLKGGKRLINGPKSIAGVRTVFFLGQDAKDVASHVEAVEPGQGGTGSAAGRADRSENAGAHRRGKPSPHERSREPENAAAEHGSAAHGRGRDGGGTTESQRRRRSQAERQRREAAQRAAERTAAHTVEGDGGLEF